MYPPKLYSGPTIQSRSAARRAAQDLVNPNNPNFPIIYLSNHFLIQSGMDRQGRFRQGKGVVGGLIEERAVDGRSPYCPGLSSKRTFNLLSPRWDVFFT